MKRCWVVVESCVVRCVSSSPDYVGTKPYVGDISPSFFD